MENYDDPRRKRRRFGSGYRDPIGSQDPLGMAYEADMADGEYGEYGQYAGGMIDEERGVNMYGYGGGYFNDTDSLTPGTAGPPARKKRYDRAAAPPDAGDDSPAMRRARQMLDRYGGSTVEGKTSSKQSQPKNQQKQTHTNTQQNSQSMLITYFILFSVVALFLTFLAVIVYMMIG